MQEISRLVGRSLRAVVDLSALGMRTLSVDCDVIQADGGTRIASINGGFIALMLALRRLWREGVLDRWPVRDSLAAVSVGIVSGRSILDLCATEDHAADVDLNVVMTGSGKFVEIQGTAEGNPFSEREMIKLIDLAKKGLHSILALEKRLLHDVRQPPAR